MVHAIGLAESGQPARTDCAVDSREPAVVVEVDGNDIDAAAQPEHDGTPALPLPEPAEIDLGQLRIELQSIRKLLAI